VTPESGIRKAPELNRKAPIKALILLTATSLRMPFSQSAAKSRKAQCFQARKVPQSQYRKVHPYGGRPSVPPPVGLGRSPWCFGGTNMAEFEGTTPQRAPADGIPYRPMSAGWL
jgi:hypothetical protein